MAKRKKEKDITHSEAIELAVEEFSPFWFNSEPIFVGVNEHEGDPEPPKYSVFPLNSKFEEMDWMFFFLDPTLFSCETAIVYAKEWHRRFQHFNIQPLLILGPIYKDYLSKKTVKALIDRHRITFPLLADRDFMVHKAFGAFGDIPKLMLHHEKKIVFESSGENWLDVELKFHEYLRSTDPGLPLERPFVPEEKQLHLSLIHI